MTTALIDVFGQICARAVIPGLHLLAVLLCVCSIPDPQGHRYIFAQICAQALIPGLRLLSDLALKLLIVQGSIDCTVSTAAILAEDKSPQNQCSLSYIDSITAWQKHSSCPETFLL